MCSKLALVALFVCFAWANAVDVANLTKWYDAEVNFYERTTIQTRVIGGQPAARRQLPWHVLVGIESGPINSWSISSRFCAGSLISSHYVLSEANALRQGNRYELLLGAYDREDRRNVRRSNRVFFHPNSRPGLGNFNIAILEMTRAFTNFDLNVRPVQLAATGADYTGRYGWVSGFGSLSKFGLRQFNCQCLPAINHDYLFNSRRTRNGRIRPMGHRQNVDQDRVPGSFPGRCGGRVVHHRF